MYVQCWTRQNLGKIVSVSARESPHLLGDRGETKEKVAAFDWMGVVSREGALLQEILSAGAHALYWKVCGGSAPCGWMFGQCPTCLVPEPRLAASSEELL